MKPILTNFKDLQEPGHTHTIVGHPFVQLGQNQTVKGNGDGNIQTISSRFKTDQTQNTYRISTEPLQHVDRIDIGVLVTIREFPQLRLLVATWQNLPDSIKIGIMAMVKAVSNASGHT